MLLQGKRLLITGVLTDDSIAWHTAYCTGAGRRSRAHRIRPWPLADPAGGGAPSETTGCGGTRHQRSRAHGGTGCRPHEALGCCRRRTPRHCLCARGRPRRQLPQHAAGERRHRLHDVGVLVQDPRRGSAPAAAEGRSRLLVTLDFDNTQAWPAYDWMGVAKSALQSVTRYLARSRSVQHSRQCGIGGASGHGGGEEHPGLLAVQGRVD